MHRLEGSVRIFMYIMFHMEKDYYMVSHVETPLDLLVVLSYEEVQEVS